jgi:3D (Asp-Asp-Asp) domain-containing protein
MMLLLLTSNPSFGQNPPTPTDRKSMTVTATAYCQPGKTASGVVTAVIYNKAKNQGFHGHIALSRDLERQLKVRFGDIIMVGGKKYIFADRMYSKWNKRVDIYCPTLKECKIFGKKQLILNYEPKKL